MGFRDSEASPASHKGKMLQDFTSASKTPNKCQIEIVKVFHERLVFPTGKGVPCLWLKYSNAYITAQLDYDFFIVRSF